MNRVNPKWKERRKRFTESLGEIMSNDKSSKCDVLFSRESNPWAVPPAAERSA